MLAKIEADKAGYEEGILLDENGYVCEGTGENLFIVKDGKIATPSFANAILGGINRLAAMEIARDLGYKVEERNVARGELYLADEIFMTGTAAELTPLREVDDHPVGTGEPGRSPASPVGRSRTRCTGGPSGTRTGTTWSRRRRPWAGRRPPDPGHAVVVGGMVLPRRTTIALALVALAAVPAAAQQADVTPHSCAGGPR